MVAVRSIVRHACILTICVCIGLIARYYFDSRVQHNRAFTGWTSVSHAMIVYESRTDTFPYDQAGPEAALYRIEAYGLDTFHDWRLTEVVRTPLGIEERQVVWDRKSQRLLNSGLDYLNPHPDDTSITERNVIILSYKRDDWKTAWAVPVYATGLCHRYGVEISRWGWYSAWVRPMSFCGLPVEDVEKLSDYATRWGVEGSD